MNEIIYNVKIIEDSGAMTHNYIEQEKEILKTVMTYKYGIDLFSSDHYEFIVKTQSNKIIIELKAYELEENGKHTPISPVLSSMLYLNNAVNHNFIDMVIDRLKSSDDRIEIPLQIRMMQSLFNFSIGNHLSYLNELSKSVRSPFKNKYQFNNGVAISKETDSTLICVKLKEE